MNLSGSAVMEAESDSAQGCPHYPCDTDMMTTNYRHRRHYAVRRKLGRAKTARLAAPASLASDAGDRTANPITLAGIEGATPSDGEVKCDLNDSAECDNEEDDSIGESDAEESATEDEETSPDVDDEEDENPTEVEESDDDANLSSSTARASQLFRDECVVSQLLADRRIVQRFNRPVPVITVVDQPGPSTEDTFFDYASETLTTPLLYPLDERDPITPHYFTATR